MKNNEKTGSFQDLLVWQKAHKFVLYAYQLTREFPKEELYGLVSQFRRAAVSIPANIVEGYKRRGQADKLRFMNMAQSSLEECRYFLILANDLEYASITDANLQLEEVSKLLHLYAAAIKKNLNS